MTKFRGYTAQLEQRMRRFARTLDEDQRRGYAALEAQRIGTGGVAYIARLLDMDPLTIDTAMRELERVEFDGPHHPPGAGGRDPERRAIRPAFYGRAALINAAVRGGRIDLARAIELGLRTQAERLKRRPTISGGQALVYGQVLDARGQPLSGVRLALLAESSQTPVDETSSDDYGDFAILLCATMGAASQQAKPGWRVRASADDGRLLYLSGEPFDLAPGAAYYLEIRIPEGLAGD